MSSYLLEVAALKESKRLEKNRKNREIYREKKRLTGNQQKILFIDGNKPKKIAGNKTIKTQERIQVKNTEASNAVRCSGSESVDVNDNALPVDVIGNRLPTYVIVNRPAISEINSGLPVGAIKNELPFVVMKDGLPIAVINNGLPVEVINNKLPVDVIGNRLPVDLASTSSESALSAQRTTQPHQHCAIPNSLATATRRIHRKKTEINPIKQTKITKRKTSRKLDDLKKKKKSNKNRTKSDKKTTTRSRIKNIYKWCSILAEDVKAEIIVMIKLPNKKISTVRVRGFRKGAISYLSSPVGISFMEQFQNGIPLVQEKTSTGTSKKASENEIPLVEEKTSTETSEKPETLFVLKRCRIVLKRCDE